MSIPEKGRFVSCALKGTFPWHPMTTGRHFLSLCKYVITTVPQAGNFIRSHGHFPRQRSINLKRVGELILPDKHIPLTGGRGGALYSDTPQALMTAMMATVVISESGTRLCLSSTTTALPWPMKRQMRM